MISIAAENGSLVKMIPGASGGEAIYGFHPTFGFISEESAERRRQSRARHGLKAAPAWLCQFKVAGDAIESLSGCTVEQLADGAWNLATDFGRFVISRQAVAAPSPVIFGDVEEDRAGRRFLIQAFAASLAIVGLMMLIRPAPQAELAPPVLEPVEVKVVEQKQRAVSVPAPTLKVPPELAQKIQNRQAKRAIDQNLGFLGMLGRKDLKKALGGMPTEIKDASAGAGAGGKEGSGGELLVGLGQGVKRTTVGNSGVAGLGGIGTKGAGGGAGGYGNSMVGSGEGKAISSIPLSQDIVLEGGLDKSVIQATIAKYLSQVRACYETGLRKNPGLMGQVTMAFEVGPIGDLNFARVAKSTLGNGEVEQCISTKMMGWKFPKPLGGVNVKANYPFLLRPVSS